MKNAIVVLTMVAMLPTIAVGFAVRTAWAGFRFGWLAAQRLVLWSVG